MPLFLCRKLYYCKAAKSVVECKKSKEGTATWHHSVDSDTGIITKDWECGRIMEVCYILIMKRLCCMVAFSVKNS